MTESKAAWLLTGNGEGKELSLLSPLEGSPAMLEDLPAGLTLTIFSYSNSAFTWGPRL